MTTTQADALPEPELGYIKTDKSHQPAFSARQMRAAMQAQPAAPGVTGAVQTLIEALKADPEYAWAWHCNIAMAAFDEGLSHYAANKAAARFLSWLAQIDMTTHPDFPKAPEQSAAAEVSDEVLDQIDVDASAEANQNPHGTLYHWRKAYLRSFARAILALRPQAVPMTDGRFTVGFNLTENKLPKLVSRSTSYGGVWMSALCIFIGKDGCAGVSRREVTDSVKADLDAGKHIPHTRGTIKFKGPVSDRWDKTCVAWAYLDDVAGILNGITAPAGGEKQA